MIKPLIFILLTFITTNNKLVIAQQAIHTAGGDAVGSAGTVNYSIGQIDYFNFNSTSGAINQGVQQPFSTSAFPVTFFNFNVSKQKETSFLEWSTISESNASHFIIESSNNAYEFKPIGKKNAVGNSNSLLKYYFTDAFPFKGSNFYRIKQIDNDGRFSYSKVLSLEFGNADYAVIYPNPTSNILVISIKENEVIGAQYELFDKQGRLLMRSNIIRTSTIVNLSSLSSATYLLKIRSTNKQNQIFTIIKK